jgi:hypothetical protein
MTIGMLGRAFDLYRRTATSRSAILLLIANLIPLVGVLLFGWSLLTILVLYWLENGIVGFWNVPKIILAQGSIIPTIPDQPSSAAPAGPPSPTGPTSGLLGPRAAARFSAFPRTGLAVFFLFHYGMFWLVHGIFVFALPAFAGGGIGGGGIGGGPFGGALETCLDLSTNLEVPCSAFGDVAWTSVLIGGIALFVSHGASFFLNYLGRGEYLTAAPTGQMGSVYGRVVVLHLTIIFGSMVVAFLGAPIGALLVLVVLKTAFDLGLHLRERQRSNLRLPAGT